MMIVILCKWVSMQRLYTRDLKEPVISVEVEWSMGTLLPPAFAQEDDCSCCRGIWGRWDCLLEKCRICSSQNTPRVREKTVSRTYTENETSGYTLEGDILSDEHLMSLDGFALSCSPRRRRGSADPCGGTQLVLRESRSP